MVVIHRLEYLNEDLYIFDFVGWAFACHSEFWWRIGRDKGGWPSVFGRLSAVYDHKGVMAEQDSAGDGGQDLVSELFGVFVCIKDECIAVAVAAQRVALVCREGLAGGVLGAIFAGLRHSSAHDDGFEGFVIQIFQIGSEQGAGVEVGAVNYLAADGLACVS